MLVARAFFGENGRISRGSGSIIGQVARGTAIYLRFS